MRALFPADLPRIFIERHAVLVKRATECLSQALAALRAGLTPDVITLDLDSAAAALKEITGSNACSDKLDEIFARFCVGK
ncbi:MAG: tRNA modification GTPase MnmE [Deltaproteobacteria bacterium ADurb.Bin510]|nr:MAG: tRNA modification GTPase MnmE [Deltaproteobacteria bacterium ADurb.Bin510]